MKDLRSELFGQFEWAKQLRRSRYANAPVARAIIERTEPAWWIALLNVALYYAKSKGLYEHYIGRLSSLRPSQFYEYVANAEGHEEELPLWEILNELVVAAYLEHALGWIYVAHEPEGTPPKRGDWQFLSPSGRTVFVEVKSIAERRPRGNAVFMRGSYAPRIRSVLGRAYRQLPDDERSTLVVLVADWMLEISHGIVLGDFSAALFGEYVVTFPVMVDEPEIYYAGPSFREMHVNGTKHRRLGAAAGLRVFGQDVPILSFYAIHNPFSRPAHQIPAGDFGNATQLRFEDGMGQQVGSLDPRAAWQAILAGLRDVTA